MISIGNETNETRVVGPSGVEVVLKDSYISIRLGMKGWRAGIAYRGPRSVMSNHLQVRILDYVLLARLVSLAIMIMYISIRRSIK